MVQESQSDREQDVHAAIGATHHAWVTAVGRSDVDALRDLLTGDYEAWPAGAAPIVGREAAIAQLMRALESVSVEQSFVSSELVVMGDIALDRGVESFTMTPRDGGPQRRHRQRAVILLRREPDGRWRYAW